MTPVWAAAPGSASGLQVHGTADLCHGPRLAVRIQVMKPREAEPRNLVRDIEPPVAQELAGTKWLTPFGVGIRYPGDFPETLPGDERRALGLAQDARASAIALLTPFLSENDADAASGDPEER